LKRLFACITLLAIFLLAGCGSAIGPAATTQAPKPTPTLTPTPDGYLDNESTQVEWAHWTESSAGQLAGTWNAATLQDGKIQYADFVLTGVHNDQTGSIGLTLTLASIATSADGTLQNGTLALQMQENGTTKHLTLHAASNADYQTALNAFKAKYPS